MILTEYKFNIFHFNCSIIFNSFRKSEKKLYLKKKHKE